MPRPQVDTSRRVLTLDTASRKVDIPTDAAGHVRRARAVPTMEIRAAEGDDDSVGFVGHACPFSSRTWIGGRYGFWEEFERGAFAKTIREKRGENNDITFNRDHDNLWLLARTSNGTLRLAEDDEGLAVDADMGAYSYARDIELALKRRDLTGMSFAFSYVTYEWSIANDGNDLLTVREVELYDVAVVGMPAYQQTDAGLRSELLACVRAQGFDEPMIAMLAQRLADPDDELVEVLRGLARPLDAPAAAFLTVDEVRRLEGQPAAATGDTSPPAETTGQSTVRSVAFDHLSRATELLAKEVG